jgi:UDPglucose 6-dehydrogenase
MENAKRELGGAVEYAGSARECIQGTDCCLIATEWAEFRLKPQVIKKLMPNPVVLDGRRLLDPSGFMKSGIIYRRIGGPQ